MLGRAPKKSFFLQRITSWSIDAKPRSNVLTSWCMMLTLKRQSVKLLFYPCHSSHDQVNIILLIKTSRTKMFGRASKKSFFLQRITSRSVDASWPNIIDIMEHDVNIKEKTNAKYQVLALSLFSTCIYFQLRKIGHILKSSMPKYPEG